MDAPASGVRPLVIAHRGASWDAPEHTLPAYAMALEAGADVLEPDLQMTADGVLVAFHDDTLERTARHPDGTPAQGLIRDRTLAQLQPLEVGSWFNQANPDRSRPDFARGNGEGLRIPTLDELLERWGASVRWYPETKAPEAAPGMEEALVKVLGRHGLLPVGTPVEPAEARVFVQSFSEASLRRMAELAPGLPRIQLLRRRDVLPGRLGTVLGRAAAVARGVGPDHRLVNERFVGEARARGLFVHPWTVNHPDRMDVLLALGVDGIFSDRPGVLRKRVDRLAGTS